MKGIISVTVKDSRNSYKFELKRNITVLTGESGRGKTTLYEMISDYNRFGKSSGIKIACNVDVIAVDGIDWKEKISEISNSVIIIDEDNSFVRTAEFAETVKHNSNYFLLITRAYLEQLPVSVDEIYEVTGNKNKKFDRVYTDINKMYNAPNAKKLPFKPEVIITEDSKSGNQFFSAVAAGHNIQCISANGKSNIVKILKEYKSRKVLIIADGAAFGSEIRDVINKQKLSSGNIAVFLPESFEWLILKSGLVNDTEWEKIVFPENYADSELYFSWERYFTDLLVSVTSDEEYKKYPRNKSKLPAFYIHEKSIEQIRKNMTGVDL
ncbi:hypothetical protein [Ruminococcus sp. HUN007]|uniref:hypothetical protein n=1 Tax=Ruminococcus sp. HUN007 TaxID=1514668 RepID=UPI0005D21399|nr:hypothetical protein [Ruminococcus sp. HUN007]